MIRFIAILPLLLLLASCKAQQPVSTPTDSLPEWLTTKITQFETDHSGTGKKVVAYEYHQQTVYLVNTCVGCPDNLVYVYSVKGEVVCQFGGIAGSSSCSDFSQEAVIKSTIWPKE